MSIRSLAERLRRDDGISLVEVLVAMVVFAMIAAGMAVALVTMTRLSFDAKNRETANNLAASKIDALLALKNSENVNAIDTVQSTIGNTTYTVTTTIGWVGTNGSSVDCSASGVTLLDKHVNVSVTWPGMVAASPVVADSLLAPDSRILDPTMGSIFVRVYGADGTPRSNVSVTASGVGGTPSYAGTFPVTDASGCTYALKVPVGTYNISLAKSNFLDPNQAPAPYQQKPVLAGQTVSISFEFDQSAAITPKLAANASGSFIPPDAVSMTYFGGSYTSTTPTAAAATPRYPFISGYNVVAGNATTCAANDPANWPATSTLKAGSRGALVASSPGGAATASVPMGLATVTASDNGTIQAVQQSTGTPGCASPQTYTFGAGTKGQTYTIALPYGTYQLWVKKSSGLLVAITSIAVVGGVVQIADGLTGGLVTGLLGGGTVSGSSVTLDPRAAK